MGTPSFQAKATPAKASATNKNLAPAGLFDIKSEFQALWATRQRWWNECSTAGLDRSAPTTRGASPGSEPVGGDATSLIMASAPPIRSLGDHRGRGREIAATLTRPVEPEAWLNNVRARYAFLTALDANERRLARCNPGDQYEIRSWCSLSQATADRLPMTQLELWIRIMRRTNQADRR